MKPLPASAWALITACLWPAALARGDDAHLTGLEHKGEVTTLRPANGYWSQAEPRLFLSNRTELGIPYVKPSLSVGYGMPHWLWAGVDLNAFAMPDFVQGYLGVRAAMPVLDLAFGVRDTRSFSKAFPTPATTLTRRDVLDAPGPRARYLAWEAESVAIAPLPHAALVADFIAVRTLDVPAGRYVYDESSRVVVSHPLFFVLRMAAVARLLNEGALKLGAVGEYAFGTGRSQGVWRVGPVAALQLTDHLELKAMLTLNVAGPDQLGLVLGAYGVAGLCYRWATGERRAALPWSEPIVP